MECRFSARRITVEIMLVLLSLIPLSLVFQHATMEPWLLITLVSGPLVLAYLGLAVFRWRSRVRVDERGAELRRSAGVVRSRLNWGDVDELFILGDEEFELRGAGRSIRFTPAYEGVIQARAVVSSRLGSLRERLHDRALQDGELVFRMPVRRWKAHAFYVAVLTVLSLLTAELVSPLLGRAGFGFPLIVVLLAGGWVWRLRRQASALGTVVTLYRDGLLVRRLDGSRKIGWSTVTGTEWNKDGGLDILQEGGKRVSLPPQLANVTLLEGFIDEARSGDTNR